ncbi:RHS repeat domain-containing protein [Granulicella cerasi]|uniref:RHS repeat domain-containing protein n=1 Tax=Granulicella cerasi TaxID=741063 RepID=UPI0021DF5890|nr:RHS repeat-associated core domain-containing protein [Granulicella cerasi]
MNFDYALAFDSSVWMQSSTSGTSTWSPVSQTWGWQEDTTSTIGYLSHDTNNTTQTMTVVGETGRQTTVTCRITNYSNWVYKDKFGARHAFPNNDVVVTGNADYCPTNSGEDTEPASDGSGYVLTTALAHGTIVSPSGVTFHPTSTGTDGGTITDGNGNQITIDTAGHFTDTTGAIALTVSGVAPSATNFTYTDTTGNSQSVVMSYATRTVQTAFGCSGVAEYPATSQSLVDRITFPDGSYYAFTYESTPGNASNTTGRVASIKLPTGGTIQYAYTGSNYGINCTDGSAAGLTRTTTGVSSSAASSVSYTRTSAGTNLTHTDVNDGTYLTAYDFVDPKMPDGTYRSYDYVTQVLSYNSTTAGTAIRSTQICYAVTSSSCVASAITAPVIYTHQTDGYDGVAYKALDMTYDTRSGLYSSQTFSAFGASSSGAAMAIEERKVGVLGGTPLITIDCWSTTHGCVDSSNAVSSFSMTAYGYDETTASPTSGLPSHTTAPTTLPGNLTSVYSYADSATSYHTTYKHDDAGVITSSTDPINGTTTYTHDATDTYIQNVQMPTPSSGVALSTGATYDATYTGIQTKSTDANNQSVAITGFDSMLRPTGYSFPTELNGAVGTANATLIHTVNKTIQTRPMVQGTETTESFYDAYGRLNRTAVEKSSSNWYLQDTCYDGNGRVSFQSNRYEGNPDSASQNCNTNGVAYSYDAVGRLLSVRTSDPIPVTHVYKGQTEKVSDQNGVTKMYKRDGMGRLVAVCEVSSVTLANNDAPVDCGMDIAGTGFLTTYAYDLMNHKTTVTQGSQQRVFITDGLGRTTSVTEPESGTTTYSYSSNSTGLIVTRVKPKANQSSASVTTTTTTQYDKASRVISISYDDGTPTKYFNYDQASVNGTSLGSYKGQLTSFSNGGATTYYGYDAGGRVRLSMNCAVSDCTSGLVTQQGFTYDQIGNLLTASDGAGRTSGYGYDIASEPTSLTSTLGNTATTLVTGATYGVGGLASASYDNGLNAVNTYDLLNRLNASWICSGSSSTNCSGGITLYGMSATWSGQRMTSGWDSVLNQSMNYGYDDFNRLTMKTVTAGASQNFTYGYDRYGNRLSQTSSTGDPSVAATFNPNNQISTLASSTRSASGLSYSYDAAGNMTSDGLYTYTYDAEGNVISVGGFASSTSTFDALNRRVAITSSGSTSQYLFNPAGSRVATLDTSGIVQSEQVYFNGAQLGYYYSGNFHYRHQDHLGTSRLQTSANGTVEDSYSSLPFGDGTSAPINTANDSAHYTGLDVNNDGTVHAMFRDYSPLSGTWLSPDPYAGSYDVSNPQSLNRYAYVSNNPMSFIDPLGFVGNFYDQNGCYHYYTQVGTAQEADGSTAMQMGWVTDCSVGSFSTGNVPYSPGAGYNAVGAGGGAPSNPQQNKGICGGTFYFSGAEGDIGAGGAMGGVITEQDSQEGRSAGAIGEGWVGEGLSAGAGATKTLLGANRGESLFQGMFLFIGGNISAGPFAGFQAGFVGGNSWAGGYFEGHIGSWAFGHGAYVRNNCKVGG